MKNTQKTFRMKAAALALVGLTTIALPVAPAFADGWRHDGGGWHDGGRGWHGGGGWHDGGRRGHDDGAGIAIAAGAVGLLLGAAIASQPSYYTPPPQTIYAPAPAGYYGQEPLQAVPASDVYQSQSGQYCREYTSTVRVGGQLQQSYGTACLGQDGAWRVAN